MEIAVGGWRAGAAEREVAGSLLPEQLPRLTDEQRSVAKKLGIPEEEYARGVVASEQNRASILLSEDGRKVLQHEPEIWLNLHFLQVKRAMTSVSRFA